MTILDTELFLHDGGFAQGRYFEEVARISGDWLQTPTGKFNVFNTANDIY